MKSILIKISCLTDMSVGNGETNYSVIDNEVSKDPVSTAPIIPSSGLKGAFRQYFEDNDSKNVTKLFGSDVKTQESCPGSLKFIDAKILGQPARTLKGDYAYYLVVPAVSADAICDIMTVAGLTPINISDIDTTKNYATKNDISVEGISFETIPKGNKAKKVLDGYLGEGRWVIVGETDYKTKINLPVVARNQLDDKGKSKNLWYEEIVPHKSVFISAVLGPDDDVKEFANTINGSVVQFGGNASIGRGFCKVEIADGTVSKQ